MLSIGATRTVLQKSSILLQAIREVQQQLFALSTQITQLRRDVDKLGTAQDTIKLRQKIADANQASTAAAKSVGQKLNVLHAELKTQQTGRLVNTFEVGVHMLLHQVWGCWPHSSLQSHVGEK